MTDLATGGFAVGLLFVLILLEIPIGIALALAGTVGTALLIGIDQSISIIGVEVLYELMSQDLALIALFLLMGNLAGQAGLSQDMYNLANAFTGHRRGGLAMATMGACAGFGAICGSSIATTATMTRLALPEMRKRQYATSLAAGSVAAGSTLGIIVPPSIVLVLYGILTEVDIAALFVAAVVPACIALLFYVLAIVIYVRINPSVGPAGNKATSRERLLAVQNALGFLTLVLIISGGIYSGFFTVSEAASVGVALCFAVMLWRKNSGWSQLRQVLRDTAAGTAMIYTILIGASIFGYTVTLSGMPQLLTDSIQALNLPPLMVILLLQLAYIALGSIFDTVAAMIITLPFAFPLIIALGFDPFWWGIINVIVMEIGMISPPFGMNVFVLHGLVPETGLVGIYRGVLPFLIADLFRLLLLTLVPSLVLWLPSVTGFFS